MLPSKLLLIWAASWESWLIANEPHSEKTGLWGFRPGPTKHRPKLDQAGNFGFRKERGCTICVVKIKVLITQLICAFIFPYAKASFLMMRLKCENKDTHQHCGNCQADQLLCLCYRDSTVSLLPKSRISSIQPSPLAVQPGLCLTWLETKKAGFLMMGLIYEVCHIMRKPMFLTRQCTIQPALFRDWKLWLKRGEKF